MIFLLRWFWWRINAWSEISAMVISFAVAVWFQFGHEAAGLAPLHPSLQLVIGVALTTLAWLAVTFATAPTDAATLQDFYDRIRPFGRGWARVVQVTDAPARGSVTAALSCWLLGCLVVYAALFGTGYLLYGRAGLASTFLGASALAALGLFRMLPRVGFE